MPFTYSGSDYCLHIENGLVIGLGNITRPRPGVVECIKADVPSVYRTGAH